MSKPRKSTYAHQYVHWADFCVLSSSFFLFRLLPTMCLWLGLFDLICAWETDESRRQQQGAATESCSQGQWFLMPQEHSYPPHDGSASQESHSRAGILSKKFQWIAVNWNRPAFISFTLRHHLCRPSKRSLFKQTSDEKHIKVFCDVFLGHGSMLVS